MDDNHYDKIDRIILYELDKNCRISDTKLAKIVKKSKEAIRYRIKKMIKNEIIRGYSTHINTSKIGNLGYKMYFRLKEKDEQKNVFVEHLKQRKDVIWICTGDGNWNLGLTFYAKNHEEFYKHKNELFTRFKDIVATQTIGSVVSVSEFGNKYICPEGYSRHTDPIITFGECDNKQLDELDKRIIGHLLENGRIRLVELASKCVSNIDTVRNRMKKLEKEKIISAYVVNIRANAIGMECYKSFLYFEGLSQPIEDKLYKYCKSHPNITAYVKVIAPWDVELEIVAKNYKQYITIINGIRKEFADTLITTEFMVLEKSILYPAREKIFVD